MKRKILVSILLSIIVGNNLLAGEGDINLTLSGGFLHKKTINTVIALEFNRKYHNAFEVYIDMENSYKTPIKKILSKSTLISYPSIGVGAVWKPTAYTWKNAVLRYRIGGDIGANKKNFQASIELGLEYSYYLKNGISLFLNQKNEFTFWNRNHFRTGINIGLKVPIN